MTSYTTNVKQLHMYAFCRLLIFFSKLTFFKKDISGITSECHTVWIQIRPDIFDLGPKCLQRLSADDSGKEIIYLFFSAAEYVHSIEECKRIIGADSWENK